RATSQTFEGAKESSKSRVSVTIDSLHTRRTVNVRDRRQLYRRLHLTSFQHVSGRMIEIEVSGSAVLEHRRRERPEGFPLLDDRVDTILHCVRAWIRQNRAGPQRAWPKLHPAVKPANNFACRQSLRD